MRRPTTSRDRSRACARTIFDGRVRRHRFRPALPRLISPLTSYRWEAEHARVRPSTGLVSRCPARPPTSTTCPLARRRCPPSWPWNRSTRTPSPFLHAPSAAATAIAGELEAINDGLLREGRPYLLMGLAGGEPPTSGEGCRWSWAQICGARAIIEASTSGRHADLSQGSHFFHNPDELLGSLTSRSTQRRAAASTGPGSTYSRP